MELFSYYWVNNSSCSLMFWMFNGQREWDMDVNDRVWAGEGGGGGEAKMNAGVHILHVPWMFCQREWDADVNGRVGEGGAWQDGRWCDRC